MIRLLAALGYWAAVFFGTTIASICGLAFILFVRDLLTPCGSRRASTAARRRPCAQSGPTQVDAAPGAGTDQPGVGGIPPCPDDWDIDQSEWEREWDYATVQLAEEHVHDDDGSVWFVPKSWEKCPRCCGNGCVPYARDALGWPATLMVCPMCRGKGRS